ncbi:MAG: hypothetical protein P1U34_01555 [Coxiellaceae bacterium]|nr:hypothetical protein [Coxiellaceae bacterium]
MRIFHFFTGRKQSNNNAKSKGPGLLAGDALASRDDLTTNPLLYTPYGAEGKEPVGAKVEVEDPLIDTSQYTRLP